MRIEVNLATGETTEHAWTPPTPPIPTVGEYQRAIQAHVDAAAVSKRYNDGNALAGYAASTIPQWAAEAQTFIAWRDAVWLYAYTELDKVMGGEREQPAVEVFIAEVPVIEWPI